MWRDSLPADLYGQLLGARQGGRAEIEIPAGLFSRPRDSRQVHLVRPQQFEPSHTGSDQPLIGRFYPQGFVRGISGVHRQTVDPCRYLGQDDKVWRFDFNHPLAGYDLRLQAEIHRLDQPQVERGGRSEDWLEQISGDGPGMQARWQGKPSELLHAAGMRRKNEQPDSDFYAKPRLVHHLDNRARARIGVLYRQLFHGKGRVLDLMGSWDSHLPDSCTVDELLVHGLNREELRRNFRAKATICQDLNAESSLPLENDSLDGVICTASIEYLTQPLTVFAEVIRLLKPGGIFAVSFSNRWFPPKVTQVWTELHAFERMGLVAELFLRSKGFEGLTTYSHRGAPRPEEDKYAHLPLSDPVFLVWARKRSR